MLYDELTQPGSYICHHGVKGQKWGLRHNKKKKNTPLVPQNDSRYHVKREYGYYIDKKQYKRMKANEARINKRATKAAQMYTNFDDLVNTVTDNDLFLRKVASNTLDGKINYGDQIVPGTNQTYRQFVNDVLTYNDLFNEYVR